MQGNTSNLLMRRLLYRGYGTKDGELFFNSHLVEWEGSGGSGDSAPLRALADALWGEDPGRGAFCRLELACGENEIIIQRTRCPGVLAPWRTRLDVFVDGLRQMGNPVRLEAFLSNLLPWREETRRLRQCLCQPSTTGHEPASHDGYHARLLRRLAHVLAQSQHLPLLILEMPPLVQDWQGRFAELAGKRSGYTVLCHQSQVGRILDGMMEYTTKERRNA